MSESKRYIKTSDEKGSVNISQSVIATIAAAAATEVDGVFGLYKSTSKEYKDAGNRKGVLKGSRVTIEDQCITVDVYLMVKVGYSVGKVGDEAQRAVIAAIEEAIGIKVSIVNIHICGISLNESGTSSVSKPDGEPSKKRTGK